MTSRDEPRTPPTGPGHDDDAHVTPGSPKPRLRGWLHAVTAPLLLLAGLTLIVLTHSMAGRVGEAIYLLTGLMLFGNSAVYHRGRWPERVDTVLRRFDHSNIAIFIAGTYTPLAIMLLRGGSRVTLLSIIWGCAVLEVVCRNVWMGAPRVLYTVLYIVMGWTALFWLAQFWWAGGPAIVWLLLAGGLCYTAGAVCYALKKPNPWPEWFGFHEFFHTGTVLGAVCHLVAIWMAANR
ncbi:hemolysin III family protein [Propionibacterium australiense]|uniref:Hemolysin III family protein n=1 Tax=Propionibacterium australiense TaxID=119981 RepID=A0A8B3FLP8_9ACTN|nr:hemolysin III family protein [Propionibacterium australiense]RLP09862.1 hemolysin III family protein [Propionibacterium australiense]